MKRNFYKLTFVTLLALCFNSLTAQNQVYFREGFEPTNGSDLSTTNPTGAVAYFFNGVPGTYGTATSWYGVNVYRTTGTGCSAPYGAPHVRYRNIAGVTDSGYIVTPVVDFGIKEFHFTRSRASRSFTIWKTSDTSATTTNWTVAVVSPFFAGTVTCVDTTLIVNDATARRLKIVGRPGTDSDIDSVWLTSVNAIVPVKFGDVNVSRNNGLVKLNWNVLLEVNTEKYYIERSVNGVEFASIGSLSATNTKSYSYVDAAPLNSATSFYRLKAVDKDGKLSYSNIIRLTSRNTAADVIVTPNPIKNGTVNLQLNNFTKSDYSVSLFDASGKIAFTKKMNIESGSSAQTLQLPNTVSKGIYQLQITNGSIKMNKTVVVQ
jgi:hypothetical protein